MNLLIACEESQRVCVAFRKKGIAAFSCDLLPCSGGHPEWHIMGNVLNLLSENVCFTTMDGVYHCVPHWAGIIGFPPCTLFTLAGGQCYSVEKFGQDYVDRRKKERLEALEFVKQLYSFSNYCAIENPVGTLSTLWKKPSQIIEPYYFGDPVKKRTCLWIKGFSLLKPTNLLEKPKPTYIQQGGVRSGVNRYFAETIQGSINRSKTFYGVADAMASQWFSLLKA